jgi:hypothetical protein
MPNIYAANEFQESLIHTAKPLGPEPSFNHLKLLLTEFQNLGGSKYKLYSQCSLGTIESSWLIYVSSYHQKTQFLVKFTILKHADKGESGYYQ